jgi:hypothetical protein
MTQIKEALEIYTLALKKQIEFENTHKKVFETYKVLAEVISSTANTLKEVAKESGESIENDLVEVKVGKPREKVWYDVKAIYELAKPAEFKSLLNSDALELNVNATKLEKLVKDEVIKLDGNIMHQAFRKEMGAPSVSIKVK